ncbi:DUF5655 domain-containing protein [Streptomyces sp. NPDC050095]|uniref:DUF5655 domain-containing protein n=1 Tax=unclassified Streptomyces TaxID=2593676 RepID=UPI00342547A3
MSELRLFRISEGCAVEVLSAQAALERDLQRLVEGNLESLLGVRFLASEFATGASHGGRIDSLGIDADGTPVVVEFKRGTDSVVTQGLFYLSWLMEHRGDFTQLVRERLGIACASRIRWDAPRLICVAGGFTPYDIRALALIGHPVDLVRYRFYGADMLGLEKVAQSGGRSARRRPASALRARGEALGSEQELAELHAALDDALIGQGSDVARVERQQYRAYRTSRNFACVTRGSRKQILVYLKADPNEVDIVPGFTRDVRGVGHHGTGELEVRLRSESDLCRALPLFKASYGAV